MITLNLVFIDFWDISRLHILGSLLQLLHLKALVKEISISYLYFKIITIPHLNLGHVNSVMFCELVHLAVNFAAFIAPERLFPTVRPHVALQMTRRDTSVVALVTLVWLFSSMLYLHVNLQMLSLNA